MWPLFLFIIVFLWLNQNSHTFYHQHGNVVKINIHLFFFCWGSSRPHFENHYSNTYSIYWSPEIILKHCDSLTAAKCPSPTDSPIASGADPLTSLRRLSVTAITHRTSWRVARNSMMKPCPTVTLFSCKRQTTTAKRKMLGFTIGMQRFIHKMFFEITITGL